VLPGRVLGPTALARAAPSAGLWWLSGDRRRCKDGAIVEERWPAPRGAMMVGAKLTSSQDPASFEKLRATLSDDGGIFRGSPAAARQCRFV
jgi:hypothetical protein